MAVVSYPGVYMEEVSSGVRPIAAASTSVAAFIGEAEKGLIGQAVKVFNFTEFQNEFGGFLDYSFLSHAVYQFFNNGGTQCYVVRVAGPGTATADISLEDRAAGPQVSLTIAAISPGVWGNSLAVVIEDGSRDRGNEFNLDVYREEAGEFTHLEGFKNLSMVPEFSNFVENVTAASRFVVVRVNPDNSNATSGLSVSGPLSDSLALAEPTTRIQVNVDGDGYQELDLTEAVGTGSGQVEDLGTPAKIAAAIEYVVQQRPKLRQTTGDEALSGFTCTFDTGTKTLQLKSGTTKATSSVRVVPATENDVSEILKLGVLKGGTETYGGSVTRPVATSSSPFSHYLVGDNTDDPPVASVTAGSDGLQVMGDLPYIRALDALDGVEDVSLIAVPGIGSPDVVGAGMGYCETRRPLSDCFFIGDMVEQFDTVAEATDFQMRLNPKSSYGAVYLPWVRMVDPTGKSPEPILVPPSGFVAGVYARTDAQRGVWKAPAGTAATLNGAVGLAADFTDPQQGVLNDSDVNAIRRFGAAGIVAWGAHTIHSDAEWRYVPVRRTAILIRVSIYKGIQWAVFEPNDEPLWSQLRLNVGAFMNNLFRQGAFQGATPAEAYFVKCDGETTTQADIDLGIVNLLVGFAPLKPAEFIVVKISQKAGQT